MRCRILSIQALVLALSCATSIAEAQGATARGRGNVQRGAAQARGRAATAAVQRIERKTYLFAPRNEQMEYAVYVPPSVDRGKPSALVIVLHGLGGNPMQILPQVVNAVPDVPYIMAAPMGYRPDGWYGANGAGGAGRGRGGGTNPNLGELSEKDVMNVLDLMHRDYLIDPRRIYIMGNSMGGAGALHLGIKHRDVFAAVGARAAAIRPIQTPDALAAAKDLPMVLVHGDDDRLVPVEQSRRWAAKMKELKMTYEYHELRGVGHGVDPEGVRAIFKFFDKHSKK